MNMLGEITRGPSAAFSGALLADLREMERALGAAAPPDGPLREGLTRVLRSGGKRLRPLLAWVCWHFAGGRGEIVPLMTMLELMHTSSLIHDDFVDGAPTRRGTATINAREGAEAALRSGDYLLAAAMRYLQCYRGSGINEALSAVAQEMCLGELDQHAGLFDAAHSTEAQYLGRIRRKTALLLSECCRSGAVAGGAAAETAALLGRFGLHLGMAFQMRDDLLDWEPGGASGKARLQDARSGVITLPQLCALQCARGELLPLLERREKTEAELDAIYQIVLRTDALGKTCGAMRRECTAAADSLSLLPDGAEKNSLLLLVKSISEVKYCDRSDK